MKSNRILSLVVITLFTISVATSCASGPKGCKGMKHHRSDVRRGLAS